MTVAPKFKIGQVTPDHTNFGLFVILRSILDMAYISTNFEDSGLQTYQICERRPRA